MEDKYPKLIDLKTPPALMKELGGSAKKRFGQNFLTDERVLSRIMDGAGITKADTVLEIGPGIGTMTQALSERAKKVIAFEIDKDLIPVLDRTLKGYGNVAVVNKDIMAVDLITADGHFERTGNECGYKVVANLPYYITTPVVMKLLESEAPIESITVMVQKEVAERMKAAPGGKDYGALSLAVQYYTEPSVIAKVPCGCFFPRPAVDSAVIHLKRKPHPEDIFESIPEKADRAACAEKMFELIRAAFSQRRKMLANGIKNAPGLGLSKENTESALSDMGLAINIRGEQLSLRQFAELTTRLFP